MLLSFTRVTQFQNSFTSFILFGVALSNILMLGRALKLNFKKRAFSAPFFSERPENKIKSMDHKLVHNSTRHSHDSIRLPMLSG